LLKEEFMQITSVLEKSRQEVFLRRARASLPLKIAMAAGVAALIGLAAQVRLPLPFTPVPLTGQTFAVLLAGVLLGRKWGGISMAIYMVLGLVGVPWFNGATSGFGASCGYLLGFILAALFIGRMTDGKAAGFAKLFGLMLCASLILHIPGLIWLGAWLNLVTASPTSIVGIISMGFIPFIAGDILKAAMAAAAARVILPKSR